MASNGNTAKRLMLDLLPSDIISSDATQCAGGAFVSGTGPPTSDVLGSLQRVTVKVAMEFSKHQQPCLAVYEKLSPQFVSKLLKMVADEKPTVIKMVKRIRSTKNPPKGEAYVYNLSDPSSVSLGEKVFYPEFVRPSSSSAQKTTTQDHSAHGFPANFRVDRNRLDTPDTSQTYGGCSDPDLIMKQKSDDYDSDATPKFEDDFVPQLDEDEIKYFETMRFREEARKAKISSNFVTPDSPRSDAYGNILGPSGKPIPKLRTSLLDISPVTGLLDRTHNRGEIKSAVKGKFDARQQRAKPSEIHAPYFQNHIDAANDSYTFTGSASDDDDKSVLNETLKSYSSGHEFDYTEDEIEYHELKSAKKARKEKEPANRATKKGVEPAKSERKRVVEPPKDESKKIVQPPKDERKKVVEPPKDERKVEPTKAVTVESKPEKEGGNTDTPVNYDTSKSYKFLNGFIESKTGQNIFGGYPLVAKDDVKVGFVYIGQHPKDGMLRRCVVRGCDEKTVKVFFIDITSDNNADNVPIESLRYLQGIYLKKEPGVIIQDFDMKGAKK